jgi:multidrug efflux pump subunit AcrA (membrane-fusion protein)
MTSGKIPTLPNGQKLSLGSYGLAEMEDRMRIQLGGSQFAGRRSPGGVEQTVVWSNLARDSFRAGLRRRPRVSLRHRLNTSRLAAGLSREQVAAADAAVAQAQETLRTFDVQADRLVIRAPQDGLVMVRNVEVGEVLGQVQ